MHPRERAARQGLAADGLSTRPPMTDPTIARGALLAWSIVDDLLAMVGEHR